MSLKPKHFEKIYDGFTAPIAGVDCGAKCAPLNGGVPVCCDTGHAIPIVDKAEWKLLKSRTDLWHGYKPDSPDGQAVVDEISSACKAIECKGARHCERDNRTIACRAFPFYPYIQSDGTVFGLAYYWTFEDRCWVMSNMGVVEQTYIDEFLASYDYMFKKDPDEYDLFKEQSANQRRVFSRAGRIIPLIGRDGGYYKVEPHDGGRIRPAKLSEFEKHGPYVSDKAYERAKKGED